MEKLEFNVTQVRGDGYWLGYRFREWNKISDTIPNFWCGYLKAEQYDRNILDIVFENHEEITFDRSGYIGFDTGHIYNDTNIKRSMDYCKKQLDKIIDDYIAAVETFYSIDDTPALEWLEKHRNQGDITLVLSGDLFKSPYNNLIWPLKDNLTVDMSVTHGNDHIEYQNTHNQVIYIYYNNEIVWSRLQKMEELR